MSPERIAGRSSDPRDDVYGFGRVVEDVLNRLVEPGGVGADFTRWRTLADVCVGPDEQRPATGAELVKRLQVPGESTH
jgi:serine/threonine-protein kinase